MKYIQGGIFFSKIWGVHYWNGYSAKSHFIYPWPSWTNKYKQCKLFKVDTPLKRSTSCGQSGVKTIRVVSVSGIMRRVLHSLTTGLVAPVSALWASIHQLWPPLVNIVSLRWFSSLVCPACLQVLTWNISIVWRKFQSVWPIWNINKLVILPILAHSWTTQENHSHRNPRAAIYSDRAVHHPSYPSAIPNVP